MTDEERQEPVIEGNPESEAWLNTISKYAGDYFFPAQVEDPPSLVSDNTIRAPGWLGGSQVSVISRERFFSEVRSRFSSIPWTDRASRAKEIARAAPRQTDSQGAPIPFNEPQTPFMESLQQGLMAKFRPEARQSTMFRTRREAERRERQVKEFRPIPMTKAEMLADLENKIGSVQWRAKNPDHGPKVANRPGISRKYQEELDGIK